MSGSTTTLHHVHFEESSFKPQYQANAAPLALSSFAMTSFVYSIYLTGAGGITNKRMQRRLTNSAKAFNPNWTVENNSICVVGGAERRPDVVLWFIRPTFAQRSRPIINQCPPPSVYIELFFSKDSNRDIALTRINFAQQHTTGIEFVGICIPDLTNPIHANSNPQQVLTHAVPKANQDARPSRVPYILHWNVNNIPVYYKMRWNEHILLRCGWCIDFNIVLNELV